MNCTLCMTNAFIHPSSKPNTINNCITGNGEGTRRYDILYCRKLEKVRLWGDIYYEEKVGVWAANKEERKRESLNTYLAGWEQKDVHHFHSSSDNGNDEAPLFIIHLISSSQIPNAGFPQETFQSSPSSHHFIIVIIIIPRWTPPSSFTRHFLFNHGNRSHLPPPTLKYVQYKFQYKFKTTEKQVILLMDISNFLWWFFFSQYRFKHKTLRTYLTWQNMRAQGFSTTIRININLSQWCCMYQPCTIVNGSYPQFPVGSKTGPILVILWWTSHLFILEMGNP